MNPQVDQKEKSVQVEDIILASHRIKDVISPTPLQYNHLLSERYGCHILFKT